MKQTNDMHEQMLEELAEGRGYDRGFTAGTVHAHDLLTRYIDWLKGLRSVIEDEHGADSSIKQVMKYQHQINALEHAKLTIRKGHWDEDSEMPY